MAFERAEAKNAGAAQTSGVDHIMSEVFESQRQKLVVPPPERSMDTTSRTGTSGAGSSNGLEGGRGSGRNDSPILPGLELIEGDGTTGREGPSGGGGGARGREAVDGRGMTRVGPTPPNDTDDGGDSQVDKEAEKGDFKSRSLGGDDTRTNKLDDLQVFQDPFQTRAHGSGSDRGNGRNRGEQAPPEVAPPPPPSTAPETTRPSQQGRQPIGRPEQ